MDDQYYESQKSLAQCFLTPLKNSIDIPKDVYENLKPLGKNLVAVIPGESKKITFFLTDASRVLFVRLMLKKKKLDDKFFTSLRTTLKTLEMSNLFSTGLCFKEDICVWEGVFEFDDDSKFEEVKTGLEQVMHVSKANFEQIEVK
jgi:hypothetical protein